MSRNHVADLWLVFAKAQCRHSVQALAAARSDPRRRLKSDPHPGLSGSSVRGGLANTVPSTGISGILPKSSSNAVRKIGVKELRRVN
jgi:hypothetical protein